MYNDISKSNEPSKWGKFVSKTWKWIKITSPLTIAIVVVTVFVYSINSLTEKKHPYGDYEMVYRVYYDVNTIKEYTVRHDRPISQGSNDGTNYIIKYPDEYVIRTNAPIEVVKYVNHQE